MTTQAPLRSRRTKAKSVYHVPGLRDGDAPTSPLKDTRLEAVRCKALLDQHLAHTTRNVGEIGTPWPFQAPLAVVSHHKAHGQPTAYCRAAGSALGQHLTNLS